MYQIHKSNETTTTENKMTDSKNILVGKIVAPQGIRGEVRVQTFTSTPRDFQKLKIKSTRFNDGDFKFVRVVPNSTVIIGKITGIDDRNTAETLRGTELFIERDTLPDLKADEFYQNGRKEAAFDRIKDILSGNYKTAVLGHVLSFTNENNNKNKG